MGFGGICVVGALLVSGTACAVPDAPAAPPGVIIDWHRVDPCGFVDPALPGRYGTPPERIEPFDFNACEIPVAQPAGGTIYLGVLTDNRLTDERELGTAFTRHGKLRVTEPKPYEDTCAANVVFPDLRYVEVNAVPKDGAKADPCAIAAALADSVVSSVLQGKYRFFAASPSSWLHVDPCELLTTEQAAVVAGAVEPRHGPNRHNCRWGASKPDYAGVVLNISVSTQRLTDVRDLEGRATQVRAEPADAPLPPGCRVATQHIGFARDKVETVALIVFAEREPRWLCATALDLAAKVWSRLPRTP
ncbi:DUF3558 domain-containing protein [Allokutzneria sp. A3M-2-11 16]|uniref:DUF3558 domain-containing protein n=1 Tax=Allokutzneria sp. A3M-2-11 16 TaxID=2962043 RepID=UPI0020B8A09F|nr:DUF3558 domain-containing protein [Allokutzneria sp. A3M-2-11 16]MCP3798212.1 DUF3558 domain-containing protein [Allokutzneria sp. A3M-2-11 16]